MCEVSHESPALNTAVDVLITSNSDLGARGVFMLVILCVQKPLGLFDSDIYSNPALVVRVSNPRLVNAEILEPISDIVYGLLLWSETEL